MSGKKIIIFDLDGVIIDSIPLLSEYMKESHPGSDHEWYRETHKRNIFESVNNNPTYPKRVETEEEHQARLKILEGKKLGVPLFDGIKDLLSELSEKNTLVINTSSRVPTCLPVLEVNEIHGYFDFLATKEVHLSKVEKFKIIAEKYEQNPEEMLFVTDSVGDLREAQEAHVPTIVVTWGIHTKEDFKEESGDYLVGFAETVSELRNLISQEIK